MIHGCNTFRKHTFRTYKGARLMGLWLVSVVVLTCGVFSRRERRLCAHLRRPGRGIQRWNVPPRIPLEDFFRLPEKAGFELSFNGEYYAFLQPWKDRLNIYVQRLGSEEEPVRITGAEERDIRSYTWANDERLLYMQDTGGDEDYHIFGVNRDGSDFAELTPFEGVRTGILDILKDDPEHVLMVMNQRDRRFLRCLPHEREYRGASAWWRKTPATIAGWGTDHDGKVRLAYAKEGLQRKVLYREEESQPFESIMTTEFTEKMIPLDFTGDNRNLYVFSNLSRDTLALYTFDPRTKEFGELLYEHPEVDLGSIIWSDARKKLLGVSYYSDKRHRHFFDPETEAVLRKAAKNAFPAIPWGSPIPAWMSGR